MYVAGLQLTDINRHPGQTREKKVIRDTVNSRFKLRTLFSVELLDNIVHWKYILFIGTKCLPPLCSSSWSDGPVIVKRFGIYRNLRNAAKTVKQCPCEGPDPQAPDSHPPHSYR